MNLKSGTILLLLFCAFVCRVNAQYTLQIEDMFIPIANNDVISKKALMEADTVRVMFLEPGAKEPTLVNGLLVVIRENGENAAAYMYPTGVWGREVHDKIARVNEGRIIIGQQMPRDKMVNGVMMKSKGPTISLILGP